MKEVERLTREIFSFVREIESAAYPEYMWQMDSFNSARCYMDDCKLFIDTESESYLILSDEEVIDLASKKGLSLKTLNEFLGTIKEFYGSRTFSFSARATTSYRLVKLLEMKNKVEILSDSQFWWEDEEFHEITMKVSS